MHWMWWKTYRGGRIKAADSDIDGATPRHV